MLGTDDLVAYANKIGIDIYKKEIKIRLKVPFEDMIDEKNEHLATEDAIDLLSQMLVYDHSLRITASEAMQHPYFNSIFGL